MTLNKRYKKQKKGLSTENLLKKIKEVFDSIPNTKTHKKITQTDSLMSAFAMFSLKSPSLLSFDKMKISKPIEHNLKFLYGIKKIPCDTYMREVLDEISPREIRTTFKKVFHEAQRGKILDQYKFLEGYLCLVDGTEIFNSEKVHCKNCCKKEHRNGRTTYHHQILGAVIAHPAMKQVIPLCPEPITKQDGSTKNDCERNSFYRFLKDLKKEHPRLNLTLAADALSANAPCINKIKDYGYNFIINVKTKGNKTLFEFIKGKTTEVKITIGKNNYAFKYINNVPLNNTAESPNINFFECEASEVKGKKTIKKYFSWITNHKITKDTIYELMLGFSQK